MSSQKLPLLMPLMRPPSNERTVVPILTVSFLPHAEKNSITTETVRGVGFNEFLQYASFHNLLLIFFLNILSILLPLDVVDITNHLEVLHLLLRNNIGDAI